MPPAARSLQAGCAGGTRGRGGGGGRGEENPRGGHAPPLRGPSPRARTPLGVPLCVALANWSRRAPGCFFLLRGACWPAGAAGLGEFCRPGLLWPCSSPRNSPPIARVPRGREDSAPGRASLFVSCAARRKPPTPGFGRTPRSTPCPPTLAPPPPCPSLPAAHQQRLREPTTSAHQALSAPGRLALPPAPASRLPDPLPGRTRPAWKPALHRCGCGRSSARPAPASLLRARRAAPGPPRETCLGGPGAGGAQSPPPPPPAGRPANTVHGSLGTTAAAA